jgi:hypothetical protein
MHCRLQPSEPLAGLHRPANQYSIQHRCKYKLSPTPLLRRLPSLVEWIYLLKNTFTPYVSNYGA